MSEDITLKDVIAHMNLGFQQLESRFGQMEDRFSNIERNFDGLKSDMNDIKNQLIQVDQRLAGLEKKVWNHVIDLSGGLRDHEQRIKNLELLEA